MPKRKQTLSPEATRRTNAPKSKAQKRLHGKIKATAKKPAASKKKAPNKPLAKFNPRFRSAAEVKVAISSQKAAGSSTPQYLGFDVGQYPGDDKMTAFWSGNGTPFYWTGFYLPSEANSYNNTWMSKRAFLAGLGYGFAIIYVGRRTTDLTYARGQTDGDEAVNKAIEAGFTSAIIFLDIEAGAGSITTDLQNYINGWLDKVDSYAAWYPGVYCSYKTNADQIKAARPHMNIAFWPWNINAPPSPGCSTDVGTLQPSDCGVSYASVWQYAQNCSNQTWNGKTINPIDLDISNSQNPSSA
jgi:hypothetical protein